MDNIDYQPVERRYGPLIWILAMALIVGGIGGGIIALLLAWAVGS